MTVRAALYGGPELDAAAGRLGLNVVEDGTAMLAIVDLRDDAAVARAATRDGGMPRIVVASETQRTLVAALGVPASRVATSCEPAELGPLIAAALPAGRRATRSLVITAVRGGAGRSLLAANLARRLASTRSTLALDLTGSGDLGWWLGASPSGWAELEGLAEELSSDHLGVIAAEPVKGLRLVGGPPQAPSARLAAAIVRAGLDLADLVIVDAPNLCEPRTRELMALADRTLVLSYEDPVSLAALAAGDLPEHAWLIASQSNASTLAGREVFRALPRADDAIALAAKTRREVNGQLGAAYDELATLIAVDAS